MAIQSGEASSGEYQVNISCVLASNALEYSLQPYGYRRWNSFLILFKFHFRPTGNAIPVTVSYEFYDGGQER